MASGMTERFVVVVVVVLLADQHRKRPCLSRASACFLDQGTEYLQQVTQSAVKSAGTWYQRFYFLPVLGKRLPVKNVSRLILSYATLWLGHHRNTDAHRVGKHNCGVIYRTNKAVGGKIQPNERAV